MENSSLQPTLVTGGSLRPYQLKGLAWLKVLLTVIFMALKEGITKQFFKVLLEVVSFKVKDQTRLCDFITVKPLLCCIMFIVGILNLKKKR